MGLFPKHSHQAVRAPYPSCPIVLAMNRLAVKAGIAVPDQATPVEALQALYRHWQVCPPCTDAER